VHRRRARAFPPVSQLWGQSCKYCARRRELTRSAHCRDTYSSDPKVALESLDTVTSPFVAVAPMRSS
jgi:hypothetical protein